jgi:hypothetical protein
MPACRLVLPCAAALALLLAAAAARAQPASPKRDPAAAEVLFRGAQEALEKGDRATACARFEASMALDPAVSTLINIAMCHEHDGKVATAWAELNRALVLNGETAGPQRKRDLEAYARRLITGIEPRLPKITVLLRARPAGLRVTRDGVELAPATLGEALPVDPGSHEVRAAAPGHRAEKRVVTVAEGKAVTVEIALVAEAAPPPPAPAEASARRTAGFVVGGAGVAGLIAGGVLGGLVLGKKSVIGEHCGAAIGSNDPRGCDATGLAAANAAKPLGIGATVGFALGAAALGTGLTLVLISPAKGAPVAGARVFVDAGPGGTFLGAKGVW